MPSEFYNDGTVTLTSGSAAVTGEGTGWEIWGIAGGTLLVEGKSFAIASVVSDTELLLTRASPVDIADAEYDIALVTADQATLVRLNELQSQQLARGVLVKLKPDGRGSLAGRDAYDAEPEGFVYGINDNPPLYVYYEKASDAAADWAGPFQWYGPEGEAVRGDPGASDVVGTSASSVAIGIGAKVFTIVEPDRGWGEGARLRVTSDANAANFMEGAITSYSGSTLTLAVDLTGGAGTHSDWTINVAGLSGHTIHYGSGAPSNLLGSDGDTYINQAAMTIYGPKTAGSWGSPTAIVTSAYVMNIDGGDAFSTYGGIPPVDGGDAFSVY